MELEQAIRTRRSIRKYQKKEIPTDLILKAVELATWAPHSGGQQSWKFYVVKNREMIDRVADMVQAKVDMIASWPESRQLEEKIRHHRAKCAFFRPAQALVVIGMGHQEGPPETAMRLRGFGDPDSREMASHRAAINSRAQTVGAATCQLLLGLHSLGLAACWVGGTMLARGEIAELLQVPDGIELFTTVAVGFPAEAPEPAPRKPLEEIVKVF